MSKKPIIGITLDWSDEKTYSKHQSWYALRDNYAKAVIDAGGVPIMLANDINLIDQYINIIDGLIIPGGDHDIPPSLYGEEDRGKMGKINLTRVNFEKDILKAALDKNMPVLGICAGEQLIAVHFGMKLIQDIATEVQAAGLHTQSTISLSHYKPLHKVKVLENSLLHKVTKSLEFEVNSTHHQAVKDSPSKGIVISARAEDGIIEAIEHSDYKFVLGVEWHPEYQITEADSNIFKAFIKAC